jgi:hypothetical protein
MAVSPNTATRSRSSSAATPDAIFDEPTDNIGCSHISALLADPTESDPLLKRFRRVVTWKAQRTHEALHSAKRRKVCPFTLLAVSLQCLVICAGSAPDVWDVPISNTSSIRMP